MAILGTASTAVNLARTTLAARPKVARWLHVELAPFQLGESSINASQLEDIQEFLRSAPVVALTRIMAIILLTESGASDDAESLRVFRPAFSSSAIKWNVDKPDSWKKNVDDVWVHLEQTLRANLPSTTDLIESDEDDNTTFSQFVGAPLSPDQRFYSRFHRRLLELAGNTERLSRATLTANEIVQSAHVSQPSLFNHLDVDLDSGQKRGLYVERTLRMADEQYSTDQVLSRGAFRLVILGDPGAGKTTLIEHLASSFGKNSQGAAATCLVLRCRNYAASDMSEPLVDALTGVAQKELGLHDASREDLDDILLLGRCVVVYDGLDEILNSSMRAEFVKRVEVFASHYPMASIVVTSRDNGYSQTPFNATLFEVAYLDEFTVAQREDYATRWFTQTRQPELISSFLHESQTLPDIVSNPLMLSLLCSLYRAYGALPTNRFLVYEKCADLLFVRWDAHRQIISREDLPDYAARIMEQIASLFYLHQSAQGGVDERQLLSMISRYMTDTSGAKDAETRALRFLEFCAGRAWLLARVSTHRTGVPIYNFTHRTFYEYFAAKALVRSEEQVDQIAQHVVKSHATDKTSVLPELLIQAKDNATERGASRVFGLVCEVNAPSDLILRLMKTNLPRLTRQQGFDLLRDRWSRQSMLRLEVFEALLELHVDPRDQFVSDYLEPPDGGVMRRVFLDNWAAYRLAGHPTAPLARWEADVDLLVRTVSDDIMADSSGLDDDGHLQAGVAAQWLVASGHFPANSISLGSLLATQAFGQPVHGAAFHAIRESISPQSVRRRLASQITTQCEHGKILSAKSAAFIGERFTRGVILDVKSTNWDPTILLAACGIGMIFSESGQPLPWLNRMLLARGIDLEALSAYRLYRLGRGPRPDDELGRSAARGWQKLASWVRDWARGNHHLLI